MADKKFAFESVSIAFTLVHGLDNIIVAKKILTAVIELAPNCVVDIFAIKKHREILAKTLYADIKNVNLILLRDDSFKDIYQKYDLVFRVDGCWYVNLEYVNDQRLQEQAPALFQAVTKIREFNIENIRKIGSASTAVLRFFAICRILDKSCYDILSCDGALPIRDNKVNIPLSPEYKPEFDKLNLGKYITIYSAVNFNEKRPMNKTWSVHRFAEYVDLMKKRFPDIKVVQCGVKENVKIENVDRHFLEVNWELTKYILANSLLHVGCDDSFTHLATQLGTKCLVLFGFTPVEYFGYKQNINLVSDVCFPCMCVWENGSGRTCMRDINAKESLCMSAHTPQKVCEVACDYLNELGLKKIAPNVESHAAKSFRGRLRLSERTRFEK